MTDSLQAAGQNKYLTERWLNLVTPQKRDTRSADEIALDIIERAGLRLASEIGPVEDVPGDDSVDGFVDGSADGMEGEINESIRPCGNADP